MRKEKQREMEEQEKEKQREMEREKLEREERLEIEKEKLEFQLKMKQLELQDKTKPKSSPLNTSKLLMLRNTFDLFLHFKKKRLTNIFYILRRWQKT